MVQLFFLHVRQIVYDRIHDISQSVQPAVDLFPDFLSALTQFLKLLFKRFRSCFHSFDKIFFSHFFAPFLYFYRFAHYKLIEFFL